MSFDAGDRADDHPNGEQALLERERSPSAARSSPDVFARSPAERSDGSARAPAPQQQPAGERPVIDSPPLHDEELPEQGRGGAPAGKRRGLLRRHPLASVVGLILAIPVAAGAYVYWDYSAHFQSTDDSFIAARQFAIAPKVSGYITAVPVTDNQHVAAGQVIAQIDPRDYRVALDQAKAQLAHDQALVAQAQKNLGRFQYLASRNSIAQQQVDDQTFLVEQDKATVALDQAKVDAAQLDLSHTVIDAAQAGRVVSLGAAVGQYAQAGTTLTMFVPDESWVTANFKETQLDAMRPGQKVTLTIDAYPDRTIRGHVASVQPGSGPAFSLLPPENATGNWVKIVQRVPVKIVMDDPPADVALGPGMSVETNVRVNPSPSLYERLRAWL
jgi:membrane fusion protein, multidrug efflux system